MPLGNEPSYTYAIHSATTQPVTRDDAATQPAAGNTLIEEGRVGKFRITRHLMQSADYEKLLEFMSHFLIVRAEDMFIGDYIEYQAYSPLFGVTDPGEEMPQYDIEIHGNGTLQAFRRDW